MNNISPKANISEADMARMAGDFLKRVQLSGAEVPAYLQVQQWLMMKANPMAVAQAQAAQQAQTPQHELPGMGPGPAQDVEKSEGNKKGANTKK